MSTVARNPYEEPESSSLKIFGNFLLLSLLAHAVLVVLLLLWAVLKSHGRPVEKPTPTVNLQLMPPPKTIFVPTTPDPKAPHKPQQVESANDRELTSKNQVARKPDSIMPDVTGKPHGTSLNEAPKVDSQKPEVSSTPPTPKPEKPQKPAPPQPQAQPAPQAQPKPTPQPPTPPTPPKPQQQVDANGLPLLPPINAPTLAPPNSAPPPMSPPPVQQQVASSVHGALGRSGDNSPAAMATELGRYKQYVYAIVGSYWYPDIDKHFGIIPVGVVRIRYTIHSDGTLTDVTIEEGDSLDQLKLISKHALVAPAPYKQFSDAMIKEVGDSYTDEFSFSVY